MANDETKAFFAVTEDAIKPGSERTFLGDITEEQLGVMIGDYHGAKGNLDIFEGPFKIATAINDTQRTRILMALYEYNKKGGQ